jgi:hypothetical protein
MRDLLFSNASDWRSADSRGFYYFLSLGMECIHSLIVVEKIILQLYAVDEKLETVARKSKLRVIIKIHLTLHLTLHLFFVDVITRCNKNVSF